MQFIRSLFVDLIFTFNISVIRSLSLLNVSVYSVDFSSKRITISSSNSDLFDFGNGIKRAREQV